MVDLDLAKDVSRAIWIQDYDEDGVMSRIKSVFKDYKIHIWNSVCPSMIGITVTENINSDLHKFIYWVSQKFTGKDVLIIMDFDVFIDDYRVLRAIRLSKPYLEKKDCYIICLSSRVVHDNEYSSSDLHSIKSTMLVLKERLEEINSDKVVSIINEECSEIGVDPKNIDIDDNVSYMLSYMPKPVIKMMVKLSLKATGKLDKDFLKSIRW
ncbi:MAG: hypothetical protein QXD03_05085 [Candidatus Anstonellales archaeon]